MDGWRTDDRTDGWKGRPPPDRLRILYIETSQNVEQSNLMWKCIVKSYWGKEAEGVKKHLFPFQGGVEFLGVNNPLLFEGEGGRGFGFILSLKIKIVTFSNFWMGKKAWFFSTFLLFILERGKGAWVFFIFFYSWIGEVGVSFTFSSFVTFFNSWRGKGGTSFF